MTYKKQQWKTGEIITEGKLNHIEDGIYNTDSDLTESKTLFASNILDLQTNKANQSDVVSINQEITNISADLSAAEADILTKAAQADVDTISNNVDTLQTQVTTNTNNIKSLQDNTVNKSELDSKQDKLTAGNNITIVDNIISATTSGGEVPEVTGTKPIVVSNNNISLLIGDNLSISDDGTLNATGGSSTPDNMVTTDTAQTISGYKTFNSGITVDTQLIFPSAIKSSRVNIASAYMYASSGMVKSQLPIFQLHTPDAESDTVLQIGGGNQVRFNASSVINTSNQFYLHQGNVTAGDNILIENTDTGIKISSTSSGDVLTASAKSGIVDNLGNMITVPDTTYQELTIPTAGVWYKSPGNGYMIARFMSSAGNQFCQLGINTTGTGSLDDNSDYNSTLFSTGDSNGMSIALLISEDHYWACNWDFGQGCKYVRFIPLVNK